VSLEEVGVTDYSNLYYLTSYKEGKCIFDFKNGESKKYRGLEDLFEIKTSERFRQIVEQNKSGVVENGYYKIVLNEEGCVDALIRYSEETNLKYFTMGREPLGITLDKNYRDMAVVVKEWDIGNASNGITKVKISTKNNEIFYLPLNIDENRLKKLGFIENQSSNTNKQYSDQLVWMRLKYEGQKPIEVYDILDDNIRNYEVYQLVKMEGSRWLFTCRNILDINKVNAGEYNPKNTFALNIDKSTCKIGNIKVGDIVEVGYALGKFYGVRNIDESTHEVSKVELVPVLDLVNKGIDIYNMRVGMVLGSRTTLGFKAAETNKGDTLIEVGLADGGRNVVAVNSKTKMYEQSEISLIDDSIGYFNSNELRNSNFSELNVGDLIYFNAEIGPAKNIIRINYSYSDLKHGIGEESYIINGNISELLSEENYWLKKNGTFEKEKINIYELYNPNKSARGILLKDYYSCDSLIKFDEIFPCFESLDFHRGKLLKMGVVDSRYVLVFQENGQSVETYVPQNVLIDRVEKILEIGDEVIFYTDSNLAILEFQPVKDSNRTKTKLLEFESIKFINENVAIVDLIDDKNRIAKNMVLDIRAIENRIIPNNDGTHSEYFEERAWNYTKYQIALLGDNYIIFAKRFDEDNILE
jgi:hypothetical protein